MEKFKLGEICDILNGYAFKSKRYVDEGIRIIRITNVQKGVIEDSDPKYYDVSEKDNLKNYMLKENDLLISLTGNVGRVGLMQKELLPAGLNQRVGCLRIKDEKKINVKYLYQCLNNDKFERDCINNSNGIAQKNLSTEWLKNYEIVIPNMDTQKQIASKLEKTQKIIEIKTKQIKELDELIESKFIEMFGNPIAKTKWRVSKLQDVSLLISDGSNIDKKLYKQNEEVLFLRIQNVWRNEFRLEDSVYISKETNQLYKDTSLETGDLLITKIGRYYTKDSSLGRVAIYRGENNKANYSNNVMRIRLNEELNGEFVNILLNLGIYQNYIRTVSVGGTDKRALSKAIIGLFPIIVPQKDLQLKFVKFLKQINKYKYEIQRTLEEVVNLQESLMNKYFENR